MSSLASPVCALARHCCSVSGCSRPVGLSTPHSSGPASTGASCSPLCRGLEARTFKMMLLVNSSSRRLKSCPSSSCTDSSSSPLHGGLEARQSRSASFSQLLLLVATLVAASSSPGFPSPSSDSGPGSAEPHSASSCSAAAAAAAATAAASAAAVALWRASRAASSRAALRLEGLARDSDSDIQSKDLGVVSSPRVSTGPAGRLPHVNVLKCLDASAFKTVRVGPRPGCFDRLFSDTNRTWFVGQVSEAKH